MYKISFYVMLVFFVACSSNTPNANKATKPGLGSSLNSNQFIARYNFAHKQLRKHFFANPEQVMRSINQQGNAYFKSLLGKSDVDESYHFSEIKITKIVEAGNGYLLLNLPRPHAAAEAYSIALVLASKEPGYFILEKLEPDEKNEVDEAIFCEWDKSGSHLNTVLVW